MTALKQRSSNRAPKAFSAMHPWRRLTALVFLAMSTSCSHARTVRKSGNLRHFALQEPEATQSESEGVEAPPVDKDVSSDSDSEPTGLQSEDDANPMAGSDNLGRETLPNEIPPPAMGGTAKPQLYFLFMVYVSIAHEGIWKNFFASAVPSVDFRALVHCKSEASCRQNIVSQEIFEIIPSVETQYCLDLVSGMNALLKAALGKSAEGGSVNMLDKFVFVSDSTLPVKPFAVTQHQLTTSATSDFCIFPRNEWAEVTQGYTAQNPMQVPITKIAVKHHQWIVLSRKHAELSVSKALEMKDIMQQFQLNAGFRNTGCLDEFWHFATIFNTLELGSSPETVSLQDFGGGPLSTGNYEIQGHCDTFVHWLPRASGKDNNMTQLAQALSDDPGTQMTPVTEKRPASIQRLSKHSMARLRESPFLFARKIEEGTVFSGCSSLDQAFDALIFSTPPRELPVEAATWRGQGQWLDNRQLPVTVSSMDGSLQLSGQDSTMQAKGSYCNNKIEVVFTNGYRATSELSADGQWLRWDNGVAWQRPLAGSALASAR
jgi:hypothetical protein